MTETLRAGHRQLTGQLDAIADMLDGLVKRLDQTPTTRRMTNALQADVERARSTVDRMEQIVTLPKATLYLGRVEVSDLLIEALALWKTRAPQRTFELALPGHEPTLLGDSGLIRSAIEALITWAAAHSGPGDIRVSLRHSYIPEESEGDDDVVISVRCPLDAEDATQAHALVSGFGDTRGVSAIELMLARAVAERHGGSAWAEVNTAEQAVTLLLALPLTPSPTLPTPHPDDAAKLDTELGEEPGTAPALARARSVILVAHGDPRMARYLRANLDAADFTAKTATTLDAALSLIELEEPDLMMLDLALPDEQRREPLARVMARTMAPVLALGESADPAACVHALDAGAADFIAQPLSVEEALARVRRALRPLPGQAPEPRQRTYSCGDLVIDDEQRLVTVGGRPAALSKTEYRLLRALAQSAGKTLSHESLLAQVWGPAYSQEIEFVWVYIRRLRRKVEPDPAHPCYILTAPGIGYRLAHPPTR